MQAEMIAQLKQIPFFEPLNTEQMQALIDLGTTTTVPAGTVLFQENDLAEELFLILSGSVLIHATNAQNKEVELAHLKAGQFFGELALADEGQRSATAETESESRLFTLSRESFITLISQSPSLLSEVIRSISQKIRDSNSHYFEEQLDKQAKLLDMQTERNALLGQLVTGVAHEFNTPLGIIKTSANIFNDLLETLDISDEDLEDAQDTTQLINTQIDRMHALIQTFKSISPTEVYSEVMPIQWQEQYQEFLKLYQSNSLSPLRLEFSLTEAAQQEPCWSYPDILNEIFMALLLNCEIHAYPEDKGKVFFSIDRQANTFILSIKDQGKGMPKSILDSAFQPFTTTERLQGCSGLGLAVVHNMVTYALKGKIKLYSEPDKGTDIQLLIPLNLNSEVDA